jgi:hypothetical protein
MNALLFQPPSRENYGNSYTASADEFANDKNATVSANPLCAAFWRAELPVSPQWGYHANAVRKVRQDGSAFAMGLRHEKWAAVKKTA